MVRKVGDKLVKEDRRGELYIVPPKGEYELEITGYALPFEMARAIEYGGGTQTMTRLELTITSDKGKGKMFDLLYGCSMGQRSNLGKLLRRANVDLTPINGSFDLDRVIGYKFRSFAGPATDSSGNVKTGDDGKPKYAQVVVDTVEPVSKPERAWSIEITDEDLARNSQPKDAPEAADDGWA